MLRAYLGLVVIAMMVAGCSGPRGGPPDLSPAMRDTFMKPVAKPGDIVAAELAFARMAEEEGQWTAFREYAAEGAIMFDPAKVDARDWLKNRADPPVAVSWEPYEVWSSCDGSIGVTRGAYVKGDERGWYTTIWKRMPDGTHRWLLDHGQKDPAVPGPPELIEAHIAECPELPWSPTQELQVGTPGQGEFFGGTSDDRTLRWGGRVDQWGGRIVTVDVWDGTQFQRVLHQTIAPPAKD